MGRPQEPLERDGSPIREFAFWLRSLRKRAGLTYQELGRRAHFATSTVQAADAGKRMPTLRVTLAYVKACGGNEREWHAYWTQIQRAIDPAAPDGVAGRIRPPWDVGVPGAGAVPIPSPAAEADRPAGTVEACDGWFVGSFSAVLHLDAAPIEAIEHRTAVATEDGIRELVTSVSVPRFPGGDGEQPHRLEVELLHGGTLARREQPYESYFRNVVVPPRPLRAGERHDFELRLRIPPGQPMAPHYVHVPFRRSDSFDLRVCFDRQCPPRAVWALRGAPPTVIYEGRPTGDELVPDRFGEVHVRFRDLRLGLGYGVCWAE